MKAAKLIIACMLMPFACTEKHENETKNPFETTEVYDTTFTINTSGYWENGDIISEFNCPDSRFFPPVDIKHWDKISVINGRLPTYKETVQGKSIHTYRGKHNQKVKACDMLLPRLAYFLNSPGTIDTTNKKITHTPEVVVVIQMVETATDTLVGFRYLTGGVGGSKYENFRFLTDEEVAKATRNYKDE